MPTQTANPIPTQLNIAPRGKRWKDWQLVDGEIGFPTREAMEKYHCHPERVQALEEERLALLESNRQLNQLNDRQAAQIKELEAQMEAIGAGGVEPLRKPTKPMARYCPECGHVGEIGAEHRDCCPDGSSAFMVPAKWANELRAGFKAQFAAVQQGVQLTNEQIEAIEKQVWDLNHFDEVEREGNRKFAHLIAAASHPTQQGLDAQRWQIVHNRISGEYIAGRAHFVVQIPPVPDTNIMRGSVTEHFTKAVDFAAAQAKQGEQENG